MYNRIKQLPILLFFLSPFWGSLTYAWYSMRPMPFSETEWRSGDERLRGRMAKSVEFQKSLGVMTEKEVLEELGEPDFIGMSFMTMAPYSSWIYHVKTDYLSLGSNLALKMKEGKVHGVELTHSDS